MVSFRSLSSIDQMVNPSDGEEKDKAGSNSGRSSLRRLSFLRNSTSSIPPPLHSIGDRHLSSSTYTTSIINVMSQEPVTRSALLEALTSSTVCAGTVSVDQFQVSFRNFSLGDNSNIFCDGLFVLLFISVDICVGTQISCHLHDRWLNVIAICKKS